MCLRQHLATPWPVQSSSDPHMFCNVVVSNFLSSYLFTLWCYCSALYTLHLLHVCPSLEKDPVALPKVSSFFFLCYRWLLLDKGCCSLYRLQSSLRNVICDFGVYKSNCIDLTWTLMLERCKYFPVIILKRYLCIWDTNSFACLLVKIQWTQKTRTEPRYCCEMGIRCELSVKVK